MEGDREGERWREIERGSGVERERWKKVGEGELWRIEGGVSGVKEREEELHYEKKGDN